MSNFEKAYEFAKVAHKGQKDKAGKDYINHPLTVASFVDSEDEKIVAMLHDVLEDTDTTKTELEELFGQRVADAVALLTRDKSEDYFSYVRKIRDSGNELAKRVKLADLKHNMDLSRLPVVTQKDIDRCEQKYKVALSIIESVQ